MKHRKRWVGSRALNDEGELQRGFERRRLRLTINGLVAVARSIIISRLRTSPCSATYLDFLAAVYCIFGDHDRGGHSEDFGRPSKIDHIPTSVTTTSGLANENI